MDIARLDNLLLELTDSERAYCAGARYDWNDAFRQGQQADIDGRHVRKIGNAAYALHQEGMPEGLSIVRNSRFNPVPEHVHDYVEISYVYRGSAPQVVNGTQLTLAQNEILLLDAACPHAVGELGEHDLMLSIVISRPMLRRSLEQSLSSTSAVSQFLLNAFMQLVQESRLTRAAALLDTGATAEAAAREVGYANMSFFYKKFAERYGCTPAAYRQRLTR